MITYKKLSLNNPNAIAMGWMDRLSVIIILSHPVERPCHFR